MTTPTGIRPAMKTLPIALCLAACVALTGATACTLNVSAIDREISASSTTAFDRVDIDLVPVEPRIGRAELIVTGVDRSDVLATGHLVGLGGSTSDIETLLAMWSLGLPERAPGTVALDVGAPASSTEIWLEELNVDVPRDTLVSVALESLSLRATNLTGRFEATATSGSLDVETLGVVDLEATSGSIDVLAEAGSMHTTSGSIHLDLDGWITASATSGSIEGTIGDGGSATATSGSIELTLSRPLSRDLTLSTTSGSVVIEVPAGAPMHLDVMTESGRLSVDTSGVEYDGTAYLGDVAGGGPTLHVRASSGSIHVREPR